MSDGSESFDEPQRRGVRLAAELRHAAVVAELADSEARLTALRHRLEIVEREGSAALQRASDAARDAVQSAEASAEQLRRLEGRIAQLHRERDGLEQAARVGRGEQILRIRELEQRVSVLTMTLVATRADVERAEASRAWRFGHGVMRTANRLRLRRDRTQGALKAALRRIDELELAGAPAVQPERPEPREQIAGQHAALAAQIRELLGAPPELESWPAVSIVVLNRDGRGHLERLVDGLREHTDYPGAELVVVDEGSSDRLSTCDPGMPVKLVQSSGNASLSEANERGAAAASHDHVLFLSDDVEPFEPGWLRELVASHLLGECALTAATLVHSEGTSDRAANGALVRHRGIRLRRSADGVGLYNDGDGAELFDAEFGRERATPAVSAACMLVTRATLERLGGFSRRYLDGMADVDLGLRATAAGLAVAVTGRAVLLHHDRIRAAPDADRRALLERWGPALRRSYRLARLRGDRMWTDGAGPHVALTVTSIDEGAGWGDPVTARELGGALQQLGWRVTYVAATDAGWQPVPADVDYVMTLLDRFDVRTVASDVPVIAWIGNSTDRWLERPWFERIDVLLASSAASAALVEERTGRQAVLFPPATNAARFTANGRRRSVDCVFTGNHREQDRAVQAGLASDDLPSVYASARLVVDDTHEQTLRHGAVNAPVFDALAAGTLVLTNCADGVRELFDEDFPVWDSPESLRAQRDALLADDDRRELLAARYRDVVLSRHTYEHRAQELARILREHEERPSFCIKIGAPDWEQAERWGDLHFARAVARELRRRGHRALIQVLDEWEQEQGLSYDVVLHVKGLSRHVPKSGQTNVLWCISHPAELTGEECDGHDLVCVASPSFAEAVRERTTTPVMVLEQATDPRVFYPDPDPEPTNHHDLVYVANSRGVLRPMMRDLLPTDLDLAVYGANWDGLIDAKYVVADHVPNDELRRVYSSAKVVLADHWDDMREHGFISNRIYDALACGACVVSDDVAGLAERFGGAVATYRTAEELRTLVDRLSGDPAERAARGEQGRRSVVAKGPFASRLDNLLATLQHLDVASTCDPPGEAEAPSRQHALG